MGIRKALHLDHAAPKPPPDPNHPHEFKRLSDNWVGHGVPPVSGAGGAGAIGSSPAVTGAAFQFTSQQCAVCRRLPDDPIHFPVQD